MPLISTYAARIKPTIPKYKPYSAITLLHNRQRNCPCRWMPTVRLSTSPRSHADAGYPDHHKCVNGKFLVHIGQPDDPGVDSRPLLLSRLQSAWYARMITPACIAPNARAKRHLNYPGTMPLFANA